MMDELTQNTSVSPTPAPPPSAAPATSQPPSLRGTLGSVVQVDEKETEFSSQRDDQGRFTRKNADGSEVPSEEQVKAAQPDLDKTLSLDPDAEEGEPSIKH